MGLGRGLHDALRDEAWRSDPGSAVAFADIEAWDRAEGPASEAAAAAVRRTDVERLIPGLPARRTFMVLGCVALVAVVIDSALDWLPPADWVDDFDTLIRFGTAGVGVTVAAWSLLSEVRGWDGSDASTWFLKARVDRYRKKLEARRLEMTRTFVTVGAGRLVVYRDEGETLSREVVPQDAVIGLTLETGLSHMVLRLVTRTGTREFDWLPRDAAFEAAVDAFVGSMPTGAAMDAAVSPTV